MNSDSTNSGCPDHSYILGCLPREIPVPGNKVIEEFIGRVSTSTERISVAKMKTPPGRAEPAQRPLFDELTLVMTGKMQVEIENKIVVLEKINHLLHGKTVKYDIQIHLTNRPGIGRSAYRRIPMKL